MVDEKGIQSASYRDSRTRRHNRFDVEIDNHNTANALSLAVNNVFNVVGVKTIVVYDLSITGVVKGKHITKGLKR